MNYETKLFWEEVANKNMEAHKNYCKKCYDYIGKENYKNNDGLCIFCKRSKLLINRNKGRG